MPAKAGIPGGEKHGAFRPLGPQPALGRRQIDSACIYPARPNLFGMRRLLKKLTNPFALVAEGFLLGALLLATSTPHLVDSRPAPPPALDSSVIPNSAR